MQNRLQPLFAELATALMTSSQRRCRIAFGKDIIGRRRESSRQQRTGSRTVRTTGRDSPWHRSGVLRMAITSSARGDVYANQDWRFVARQKCSHEFTLRDRSLLLLATVAKLLQSEG
jgi:hypothetical protein